MLRKLLPVKKGKKKKVIYWIKTLPHKTKQHLKKHFLELNKQTKLKLTQERNFTDL